VLDEPEKAQRIIGYLPENNPLYKDMLVSEFLELSSALANQTAAEKTEALAFVVKAVNLENVFYRPLSELSKGYKQRVGIAAALITNPRVLVLDEPTEGLDPNQRSEVRSLIKKLSKKHTIIISTHVMQEVTAMCERILIINNGSLVADGTPDSLSSKQQPAIHLDLEGKDILESIKAIKKIDNITSEKKAKDRFHITLHANNNDVLYQTLSGLIQKKKWIVREMRTESADLEQIFHQLTMGENQLHSTTDAQ
jgi:ABC-2 type transport system ATP-binding protein